MKRAARAATTAAIAFEVTPSPCRPRRTAADSGRPPSARPRRTRCLTPCDDVPVTEPFTAMLAGGHPNSLGRTHEAVGLVLADPGRLDELFAALAAPDQLVRLRGGDALEKVCREQPEWFVGHVDRLIDDVGGIEQPSVQWHVAQMLDHLRDDLSDDQARRATALLEATLTHSTDWIVLNVTMDVLCGWARRDQRLVARLTPELQRLTADRRPSVARRAARRLAQLGTGGS